MIAADTVEVRSYVRHLARRWKSFVITPLVAVAVASLISLALPKKYDATVTLLIQPGASDPRFPQALNQVYLEYLHSYEQMVQSNELLARVIQEFHLDLTVDSFRSGVLDVQMPRLSKLLNIRVRWSDPQKAHEIALFLAKEVVRNSETLRDADADRNAQQAQAEVQKARSRLDEAASKILEFRLRTHEEELTRAVQVGMDTKSEYEKQLAASQIFIVELEGGALASEKAKQAALRKALAELETTLARREAELMKAQAGFGILEQNYNAAQDALKQATARANDTRNAAAFRSEQLQIADPGIVPQRPSSPHYLFNALLALALGLLATLVYESWHWDEP